LKNKLINKSIIYGTTILLISLSITANISGFNEKTNVIHGSIYESVSADGLIGYWSFDEGSGSIAHDDSGNGHDGEIVGATWTNGYSGFGLNFNGEDAYVDLDSYSSVLAYNKTDDYILSAWFKAEVVNKGIIIGLSHTDGDYTYATLELNVNGSVAFKTGTLGCKLWLFSSEEFNDGEWHQVEVQFFGNDVNPTIELYIDEELEDSVTDWLCPITNADFKTAKIGRRSNNETDFFDGVIDEVKIFKYTTGDLPPGAPDITGETEIKKGKEYEYTFNSEDPEGSDVYYEIKWGDGQTEEWIGPYDSGDDVKVSHKWSNQGEFEIEARAKDENDNIGQWSTFEITVPKSKSLVFNFDIINWLIEHFPIFRVLFIF